MDPNERPPAALSGGKFLITDAFDDYLKLVKLDKRKMPPHQIAETKKAFFGAVGQLIIFFQEGLTKMPEDQAIAAMADLTEQVRSFWSDEMKKYVNTKRKN